MAYLGLILAVVFWGASFVATKVALQELSPATVVFTRFAIGLIVLFLIVVWRGELRSSSRRDLPALILLGILGIPVHQWLQATGLETASAIVTSWIVATIPVLVALLGWIFLGEKLSAARVVGIFVSALGVAVVVSEGDFQSLLRGRFGTSGDVLIALSAMNWAIFTVLSKRLLNRERLDGFHGLTSKPRGNVRQMLDIMAIGWVFTIPWVLTDGSLAELAHLRGESWSALAFLGVACSGLAYFFWFSALSRIDATQAGVFLYLEPIVTVLLAAPILGEEFTVLTAVGGTAILLGVWFVNRR